MRRDAQRAKVYAAEEFVRTLFDRAAEHGDPVVELFGTRLTLPPEARFASVQAVQRYVDEVLTHSKVRQAWAGAGPLRVRSRKGATAAHYQRGDDVATIAVPQGRAVWALRELVILHEIAHHLVDSDPPHGPAFIDTFCTLTAAVMGPEAAYVLRVVYDKHGVQLGTR